MPCIFCGEELREDTKVEHLIQRSIGGKIHRTDVTCTKCNEFFANGDDESPQLDEELAVVFASTMNILKPALPADVGGASIEARDANGLVLRLEEGRTFSVPLVFERDERGRPISIAGDRVKLMQQIPKLAKQLGKDASDFEFERQEPPSGQIAYHRVSVYTPTLARAVLKSAVQVVAYHLRESHPSIADILRPAARYARFAEASPELGLVDESLHNMPTASREVRRRLSTVVDAREFAHVTALVVGPDAIHLMFVPFSAEVWVFRIANNHDLPEQTVVISNGVLRGEKVATNTVNIPLFSTQEIDSLREPDKTSYERARAMNRMSEERIQLFQQAAIWLDCEMPQFALQFIFGEDNEMPRDTFYDAVEWRMGALFGHLSGWRHEWPQLFKAAVAENELPETVSWENGETFYVWVFCRAVRNIGPPYEIVRGQLSAIA